MRKIHLTESQVRFCMAHLNEDGAPIPVDITSYVSANGGSVDTATSKAAQEFGGKLGNTDTQFTFDPSASKNGGALKEDDEINDVDKLTDDYYSNEEIEINDVYDYLDSLKGTPDFYRLFDAFAGNSDMRKYAVKEVADAVGVGVSSVISAMASYRNAFNAKRVDEKRRFTNKKAIMETRVKNKINKSSVCKKSDLVK